MTVLGHYNYWIFIFLMMVGFYTIIARGNLVKKVVGLTIFQTSVFIFYISLAKIIGGTAPILVGDHGAGGEAGGHGAGAGAGTHGGEAAAQAAGEALGSAARESLAVGDVIYSNPLPHVLILTAIVVGIATTALALALVVRIREAYGTVEEDEIHREDVEMEAVG